MTEQQGPRARPPQLLFHFHCRILIVIHAQIACEIDIRTLTGHQVFGQILDQILDQVLGQILDQIFDQVLDQGFWTRKYSVQFYRDRKMLRAN